VALTPAHAEAGLHLSAEAGWNQTAADWRLMLELGEGVGQVTAAGDLVASALIVPYGGRLAWIAMVLTAKRWQRRGLATRNLRAMIARCDVLGLVAGLDATPDGRPVYAPQGFRDVFPLQRLVAREPRRMGPLPAVDLRPFTESDLDAAVGLDAATFGAPRPEVLRRLLAGRPEQAWIALADHRIAGFVLARTGRLTLHLGPLVAERAEVAIALAGRALEGVGGLVSVDVPDRQAAFRDALVGRGFLPVRPFMRMLRSEQTFGDPARLFALAGPELG
jgi:hypothetical protein